MLILLVPLVVVLLVVGWLFLVAQPGPADSQETAPETGLPGGRLAARMTDGLDRTARAVDVLVERRPDAEPPGSFGSDPRQQRATYVVVGGGLLGLAVLLVAGLALLLAA